MLIIYFYSIFLSNISYLWLLLLLLLTRKNNSMAISKNPRVLIQTFRVFCSICVCTEYDIIPQPTNKQTIQAIAIRVTLCLRSERGLPILHAPPRLGHTGKCRDKLHKKIKKKLLYISICEDLNFMDSKILIVCDRIP